MFLTIHFGQYLYIPYQLYFWYVFNKWYPGWLDAGCVEIPGGECHDMHLGLQFPTPWKVDESIHFSVHALSGVVCSAYQVHVHTFLPKEHDIIRASCGDIQHYMMTFWWCGVFWMMIFTSVLKVYKRKNVWEVGSSKFWFHTVKIHTP